jgi:hypothetical protein
MEPTVIQLDSIASTTTASIVLVDSEFVIKAKFTFRLSRKISAHLDMTINIGSKHRA